MGDTPLVCFGQLDAPTAGSGHSKGGGCRIAVGRSCESWGPSPILIGWVQDDRQWDGREEGEERFLSAQADRFTGVKGEGREKPQGLKPLSYRERWRVGVGGNVGAEAPTPLKRQGKLHRHPAHRLPGDFLRQRFVNDSLIGAMSAIHVSNCFASGIKRVSP